MVTCLIMLIWSRLHQVTKKSEHKMYVLFYTVSKVLVMNTFKKIGIFYKVNRYLLIYVSTWTSIEV